MAVELVEQPVRRKIHPLAVVAAVLAVAVVLLLLSLGRYPVRRSILSTTTPQGPQGCTGFALKTEWGTAGPADGQFDSPYGATLDKDNNLVVVDWDTKDRVQYFSLGGTFKKRVGTTGSGNGQLSGPRDIITDASGNLYVTDTLNNRIQKFSATGIYLTQWPITNPLGIAIDASGNIYTGDNGDYTIKKFSPTGTPLNSWSANPLGTDQFQVGFMSVSGNYLYVGNYTANKIQKFDITTGSSVLSWDTGNGLPASSRTAGIGTDSDGNVYAAIEQRIRKFDPAGNLIAEIGYDPASAPTDVVIDPATGDLYVPDLWLKRVRVYHCTSNAYIEQDGRVSVQAEHYDKNYPRVIQGVTKEWKLETAKANYAGSGYLTALPNTGTNLTPTTGYVTTSPELVYRINFSTTGTYYVWLRNMGETLADDSAHVGLDGQAVSTSDNMKSTTGTTGWNWSKSTSDGSRASLNVSTPGIHNINVWMREDGFHFDQILLTNKSAYTPQSTEAESLLPAGPAPTVAVTPTSTPIPTPASASDAFIEQLGRVSMQAENYHQSIPQVYQGVTKEWKPETTKVGYTGINYLTPLPNAGVNIISGYTSTTPSPELVYRIYFSTPGTYFVWLRNMGETGADDSAHVGLDGQAVTSADNMRSASVTTPPSWNWSKSTSDGSVATINVPAGGLPGLHTLHVWMREDGFHLDQILLTQSSTYIPTVAVDELESPRSASATPTPTSPPSCPAGYFCADPVAGPGCAPGNHSVCIGNPGSVCSPFNNECCTCVPDATPTPAPGGSSLVACDSQYAYASPGNTSIQPNADVQIGTMFYYSLVVVNAGNVTGTNATLTDALPAYVQFVSATSGCNYSATNHSVTCTLGNVAVGENQNRAINVKLVGDATFTGRNVFVNTATATAVENSASPPSCNLSLTAVGPIYPFEAEAGALTAPMAANGTYISQPVLVSLDNPSINGKAAFTFTAAIGGKYKVATVVNASKDNSNSFFINMDAEPTNPTMIWDTYPPTVGFQNVDASWRGTGSSTNPQFEPKLFTLTPGPHTLIIRGREINNQLDRLQVEYVSP